MPANLNALIRYKTIDRCLGRKFAQYTVEQLQVECSEALGEFCGVYKKVSERTIRDDIRVLRSDILGFNAPIICEGGYYSYDEPNYSIFSVSIKDINLLKQVMQILLDNRMRLRDNGVDDIIRELGTLIEFTSYTDYSREPMKPARKSYSPQFDLKEDALCTEEPVHESKVQSSEPGRFSKIIKRIRLRKKIKEDYGNRHFLPSSTQEDTIHFSISRVKTGFNWGDVLKLVG
jgi:hypothetical protein